MTRERVTGECSCPGKGTAQAMMTQTQTHNPLGHRIQYSNQLGRLALTHNPLGHSILTHSQPDHRSTSQMTVAQNQNRKQAISTLSGSSHFTDGLKDSSPRWVASPHCSSSRTGTDLRCLLLNAICTGCFAEKHAKNIFAAMPSGLGACALYSPQGSRHQPSVFRLAGDRRGRRTER